MTQTSSWADPRFSLAPEKYVGTWRLFGVAGPVYEIIRSDKTLDDGDWLMRVRVVETGEVVSYKLTDILDDLEER